MNAIELVKYIKSLKLSKYKSIFQFYKDKPFNFIFQKDLNLQNIGFNKNNNFSKP